MLYFLHIVCHQLTHAPMLLWVINLTLLFHFKNSHSSKNNRQLYSFVSKCNTKIVLQGTLKRAVSKPKKSVIDLDNLSFDELSLAND